MFAITAGYLVAQFLGCIGFGLSLATCYLATRSLFKTPIAAFTGARWGLLAVSTLMVVIGAIAVGEMLQHVLNAFVYYQGEGGATAELFDIKDPVNLIHAVTYPIQCFLGDSVLVHRTYVVYERNWRMIIVPLFLLIADTTVGFGIAVSESRLKTGTVMDDSVRPYSTAFFSITVTLNVFCTGLIISRIWRVVGGVLAPHRVSRGRRLSHVVRVIVESGLIYTMTSIILLITIVLNSTSVYPVASAYIQITAICFHLIIIRTGQAASTATSATPITRPTDGPNTSLGGLGVEFIPPGLPVQIHMAQSERTADESFLASTIDPEKTDIERGTVPASDGQPNNPTNHLS